MSSVQFGCASLAPGVGKPCLQASHTCLCVERQNSVFIDLKRGRQGHPKIALIMEGGMGEV
jgi:hypothetical protein